MTLHVQNVGTWQAASDVYIKEASVWKNCTEVYIKSGGDWKPLLYAPGSLYATSDGQFVVPRGVFTLSLSLAAGRGGTGGGDGTVEGLSPGNGATITGTISVTPGDLMQYTIGGIGGDGTGHATSAGGGSGGAGFNPGGNGGQAGSEGSSGGGGAGGGSSALQKNNDVLLIAGAGGGSGGRGNRDRLSDEELRGDSATSSASSSLNPTSGGTGQNCQCADGGAGGGGGAGAPGGAGGLYWRTGNCGPYDVDGMGGQAGGNFAHADIMSSETISIAGDNTGAGYLSVTW